MPSLEIKPRFAGMPLAVGLAVWPMVLLLYILFLVVFRVGFSGFQAPLPVLVGAVMSFGLPALFAALVPFNPFRGLWDQRPGRGRNASFLSERDRRTLSAFYDPLNRRRGMLLILLAGLLTLAVWWFYIRTLAPPSNVHRRGRDVLMFFFLIGIPIGLWIGLFGLTVRMRQNWKEIITEAPLWPAGIAYPGSFRDAARSALTGRLPAFLAEGSGEHAVRSVGYGDRP